MPRDLFSWHVGLEYVGGDPRFYDLARDPDTGLLLFQEGVVPAFVEQQNTGALSKAALPADLSVFIAFEDWSGGAGLVNAVPGDAAPSRYSYSRGIDASWGDRLYMSPEKQALTTITEPVIKFVTSSFGEHAITARKVYEYSGGDWVERYDAGSDILTDIVEYGNSIDVYLVVARGDSNDIVYSTDGITFGGTSTGNKYHWLRMRGHTTVNPILVGVSRTGLVATATAIGTFTAADQAGSPGENVNGIEVANDLIILFKDEGVYTFDGTDVTQKLSANALYRPTNGKAHAIWPGNGFVYFNFDNRLLEYNPFEDAFQTVYFPEHPELNGDITAMDGTTTHLYFSLTNRDGAAYVMKGNPGSGAWHTLSYQSTNAISAMHIVRSGTIHATNDVLVFDGGSTTGAFILAQDGLRPEDDVAYRFQTGQGYIYGPLTDGGVRAMVKRLNGVKAIAENATASNLIMASYGIDVVDTSPTSALTINEDGLQEARITTDTPFTRIHYYATMDNVGSESSPRLLSLVFDVTPYPQRRRRFTFTVKVAMRPGPATGIMRRDAFVVLRRFLFGALDQQVTLTDPWRGTYIGKVQNVQGVGYAPDPAAGQGADIVHGLYQVVFEEITETTDDAAVGQWDVSDWNDGSVFDD